MTRTCQRDEDSQPLLPMFFPTVRIPQGDGAVLLRPGKPVAWLSPRQFAEAVGLHRNTVYGYLGTDAVPERFIDYSGGRKIRISVAALDHWREHFRARRGLES